MGGRPSRGTPGGSQRLWRPMAETIRGVGEEWYAVSDVVMNVCVVMRDVQQKPEGLEQAITRYPAEAGYRKVTRRVQTMMLSKPASSPRAPA